MTLRRLIFRIIVLVAVFTAAGLFGGQYHRIVPSVAGSGPVRVVIDPTLWERLSRGEGPLGSGVTPGTPIRFFAADLPEGRQALEGGYADLGIYYADAFGTDPIMPEAGLSLGQEERTFGRGIFLTRDPDLVIAHLTSPLDNLSLSAAARLAEGVVTSGVADLLPGARLVTREDFLSGGRLRPHELFVGHISDLGPGVKALSVDARAPSPGALQNGSYSLGRTIAVYFGASPRVTAWSRLLIQVHRWVTWPGEGGPGDPGNIPGLTPRLPEELPEAAQVEKVRAWLERGETKAALGGYPRLFSLTAIGDVMLARGVAAKISEFGVDYPLALVGERLAAADLTVTNLESPLGVKGSPIPDKMIWFRAHPDHVAALKSGGIDLVTLANNHILDYDTPNFLETLDILEAAGIGYFGGGRNLAEARRPAMVEINGVRTAFLGYSAFADLFWSWKYRRTFAATEDLPGVAPLREDIFDNVVEDIRKAKEIADVVVVAYHWGDEYVNYPNAAQRRIGRKTIDAGADLVLGFHPHAVQGFEIYRGKLIAYSLGNFVMDQRRPVTVESMILEMLVTPDGVISANAVPVRVEEYRPRVLVGAEGSVLLEKIRVISEGLAAAQGQS